MTELVGTTSHDNINNIVNDIRESANLKLDEKLRGKLGQFMSSSSVSSLLANMFENFSGDLRVLDAGSGVGSLTAALVNRAVQDNASSIHSTCYEVSEVMIEHLMDTLQHCSDLCLKNNVAWSSDIIKKDYIESAVSELITDAYKPKFNRIILNPPYLKIAAKGTERALLREAGIETGNLYSAFVSLAIKQLEDGGELVAITPRSFCNGPYFKHFRQLILNNCSINKIHVFNSRKSAFKTDKVLQENVIYHLTKGKAQRKQVIITSSSCAEDPNPIEYKVDFKDIVNPDNPEQFIHIITDENEREIAKKAGGLPCSIQDLGIQASTGKVVDFRTRENLCDVPVDGSVPLIFPQHLQKCQIEWPIVGAKKPNALLNNKSTANLLIPNGTYVLTRRLSSKEEKRRIVASIYTADINSHVDVVAFENKTNYFHSDGQPLDMKLAIGLWAFLNSSLVDKYFRQMNGHTQVNATDLRTLRYPTKEQLESIYEQVDVNDFNQVDVDNVIDRIC